MDSCVPSLHCVIWFFINNDYICNNSLIANELYFVDFHILGVYNKYKDNRKIYLPDSYVSGK